MSTTVYRGQPNFTNKISPRKSIWVTKDIEFAKQYGNVKTYELPNDINILNTNLYVKWENLIDEFEDFGCDYDEYKYEPSDNFIDYLQSKGYDGFVNGNNILIFNKSIIIKHTNL